MYGAEASESDSLIRCGMYEERGMDVSTARSLSIIKGIVPSWIGDLMPLLPRRQETTGIDYDFGGVSLCLRFRDSRLSERGASGRVKSWAILEDSRLSKSWLELEEKREKGVFQEQGALGLILELAKREILRLEAVSVELEKLPRTKPNTHRGVDLRKGKYVVNRRMEYASSGALGALDVGFIICVFVL
ncbi:hypothetical protein Lal_00031218 [Lupinus albus]|nr:hypothetical protein Lal_00031218 [Lupinus albus]